MVMWEPDESHHCGLIGHSRCKCPDMEKLRSRNCNTHQHHSKVIEAINEQKQEKIQQKKYSPHVLYLFTNGDVHDEVIV